MDTHHRHREQMKPAEAVDRPAPGTWRGRPAALAGTVRRAVGNRQVRAAREVLSHLPRTAWNGPERAALLLRLDLLRDCSRMGGEAFAAVLAAAMPGKPDALYALGVCLAGRGRYVQALEHLFLVAEQAPDYGSGAATAAILRILKPAGAGNPVAGRYWERLGRVLHRPGPDGGTYRTRNRAGVGCGHPPVRVNAPRRRYP